MNACLRGKSRELSLAMTNLEERSGESWVLLEETASCKSTH